MRFLPLSATASTYTVSRHRASPNFIGPRKCVPMAFTANSHWHRSGSPQGCSSTVVMGAAFSGFIMDQFFYAPLFKSSHTDYWYVVDMRDTKSIEGGTRRTGPSTIEHGHNSKAQWSTHRQQQRFNYRCPLSRGRLSGEEMVMACGC